MTEQTNKPVDTLRRGSLKISIWANPGEHGTRYSTSGVIRSYKDHHGNWQETPSLSNGELLQAARLMTLADDRITELRSRD